VPLSFLAHSFCALHVHRSCDVELLWCAGTFRGPVLAVQRLQLAADNEDLRQPR
jgi:hypothetical protein